MPRQPKWLTEDRGVVRVRRGDRIRRGQMISEDAYRDIQRRLTALENRVLRLNQRLRGFRARRG